MNWSKAIFILSIGLGIVYVIIKLSDSPLALFIP